MSYTCPMTFENIDSNVSRVNSFFVSALVITYLLSSNIFILYFLFLDFSIKLFVDKNFSPLLVIAKITKKILHLETIMVDAGAKRLAAYFGLLFVSLLVIVHYINSELFTFVIAFIFLFCSLLDVVLNYCLGCKIYYIIKKIYPNFMN